MLFVDVDGPQPHTLMAAVSEVGGRLVVELALVEPGSAERWGEREASEALPMRSPPVDEHRGAFHETFDDEACWGPAKKRSWPS